MSTRKSLSTTPRCILNERRKVRRDHSPAALLHLRITPCRLCYVEHRHDTVAIAMLTDLRFCSLFLVCSFSIPLFLHFLVSLFLFLSLSLILSSLTTILFRPSLFLIPSVKIQLVSFSFSFFNPLISSFSSSSCFSFSFWNNHGTTIRASHACTTCSGTSEHLSLRR